MLLKDNPFHILSVSMDSTSSEIIDKAEEAVLLQDEQLCREAKTTLLNPNKRIEAEVCWLPGLGQTGIKTILENIANNPNELLKDETLLRSSNPCARANVLLSGLTQGEKVDKNTIKTWISAIATSFDNISSKGLTESINIARQTAGISIISNEILVEDALMNSKHFFVQTIKNKMNEMQTTDMVAMLTELVDIDTNRGRKQGTEIVEELVEAYELEAQVFFNKANKQIKSLADTILDDAGRNVPDTVLKEKVDKLINIVKQWDKIAQPIQVSNLSKGTEHAESKQVAFIVRELAITLYNKYGKLQATKAIIQMMKDVFAEVITVAEKSNEDSEILNEISQRRETSDLKPISMAPLLGTINWCGFTIYGHSDDMSGTYMATWYFVVLGIPIVPLARYRISYNPMTKQYTFYGKGRFRTFDIVHLLIGLTLILYVVYKISR
ncbi:MAG: hypothetical protein LKE29_02325 [Acidaminococcaceae bacterium]|jgi:vacuolar-type H+-ATPase subunit H|nr:hypothetical protein [Acidaminococcaceae bacterium]